MTGVQTCALPICFTTIRNVGASGYIDVDLRDAINAGEVPGPHMLVSGPPLGITGGHCDENRHMGGRHRRAECKRRAAQRNIRKDPESARQFARKRGADANSAQAAYTRSRVPSEWRRSQIHDSTATVSG